MLKMLQVLIVILVGVTVMFGGRWYMYVTNKDTPYDEVGITLNGYLPLSLRTWGCNKLHANFPKALPPLGCAKTDGPANQWL